MPKIRTRRASRGRRFLLLTQALLVLAACAVIPAFAWVVSAQEPAPPKKIAFERPGQILTMNEDGTNQTVVIDQTVVVSAIDPQWSPDGKKLTFLCGIEPNNVCTYDIDSGELLTLTLTRDNSAPAWSPDGTKIAFASRRSGGSITHVYIMNADGTNQQRLVVNDPAIIEDRDPTWSPDGTQIAFSGLREDGTEDIYVAKADGSDVPARLTSSEGSKSNLDWSPDGTRIAYDNDEAIYIVSASGGVPQLVTSEGDELRSPTFSPEGQRLAFYRKTYIRDEEGTINGYVDSIFVADLNTGGITDLGTPKGMSPAWQRTSAQPEPTPTPTPTPDDNQAPVAIAKNIDLSAGPNGLATFVASDIDNGSYDPDPGDTLTLVANPTGPFGVGTYSVTLTATDNHGATSSATATVTVVDRTSPVITSQIIVDPIDAGTACSGEVPDLRGRVTATDNVTPAAQLSVSQTPAPGTPLALGQHHVTLTVADAAGNQAQIFPLVPVVDRTPPELFGRLESTGYGNRRSGLFNVRYGATDRCDPNPLVVGVIRIPVSTSGYTIIFQRSLLGSQIDFDVRRQRITLAGPSEAAMRQLLSQVWANDGVRVNPRQTLLLEVRDGAGAPRDGRFIYSFLNGQLVSVSAPEFELRVNASDASMNTAQVTARPVFR